MSEGDETSRSPMIKALSSRKARNAKTGSEAGAGNETQPGDAKVSGLSLAADWIAAIWISAPGACPAPVARTSPCEARSDPPARCAMGVPEIVSALDARPRRALPYPRRRSDLPGRDERSRPPLAMRGRRARLRDCRSGYRPAGHAERSEFARPRMPGVCSARRRGRRSPARSARRAGERGGLCYGSGRRIRSASPEPRPVTLPPP